MAFVVYGLCMSFLVSGGSLLPRLNDKILPMGVVNRDIHNHLLIFKREGLPSSSIRDVYVDTEVTFKYLVRTSGAHVGFGEREKGEDMEERG